MIRSQVFERVWLAVPFVLAGCASSPPPSHVAQPGDHGPRCAVIEAASQISFSHDRAAELRKVASASLTEHEQLYLIDATVCSDGFSSDKADVLADLAANPCLTQSARQHMAERLRGANLFSSDQRRVVQAMSRNLQNSPAPSAEPAAK